MIFLDNYRFSGQFGQSDCLQVHDLLVEPAGIEPATSCMPCEKSLESKCLILRKKQLSKLSSIGHRSSGLSAGFTTDSISNSGRFLNRVPACTNFGGSKP